LRSIMWAHDAPNALTIEFDTEAAARAYSDSIALDWNRHLEQTKGTTQWQTERHDLDNLLACLGIWPDAVRGPDGHIAWDRMPNIAAPSGIASTSAESSEQRLRNVAEASEPNSKESRKESSESAESAEAKGTK
jgi:hypothetical protein